MLKKIANFYLICQVAAAILLLAFAILLPSIKPRAFHGRQQSLPRAWRLKQSDQCLAKGQKDIPRIIFFGWYLPTLWVFFERISCSQVTSWYVGKDWNGKKRSGMDGRLCQSALYFFWSQHCVTIVHLAGKEAKGIPVSKHLQKLSIMHNRNGNQCMICFKKQLRHKSTWQTEWNDRQKSQRTHTGLCM